MPATKFPVGVHVPKKHTIFTIHVLQRIIRNVSDLFEKFGNAITFVSFDCFNVFLSFLFLSDYTVSLLRYNNTRNKLFLNISSPRDYSKFFAVFFNGNHN